MHMADALITPAVGGTMWAVSGGLIAWCARKVKQSMRDDLVPLMGVLGAFVFAAQMINFTIPGTGSSGHLGGGLMLAILLGPQAAFLVIASVLTVQAFFFADGGLLALGCNLFNMGFFPAFVAYPLIYRPLAAGKFGTPRAWWAAVWASMASLLMGSVGVVIQTTASGISELPFGTFLVMMVPIHLAIGLVEGLATAVVVDFVARARPEVLQVAPAPSGAHGLRPLLIGLGVAALLLGGVASWFASTHPDGLEWSIARVTGQDELAAPEVGVHERLSVLQESTAILPDYGFKIDQSASDDAGAWPSVSTGTSVSGLAGGVMTLGLALLAGFLLRLHALRNTGTKGA